MPRLPEKEGEPMKRLQIFHVMLFFVVGSRLAAADDWPQWRGPERDGISKETGLLSEWPEEGPALVWKKTGLGGGDSTPSIAAGRIYGMSNRGDDEVVWALSEKDGREIWASRIGPAYDQRYNQSNEGPGSTPTVDGDHLYLVGMAGNIACLRAEDGKVLWQRSMTQDFGGSVPPWSYRESPLIDGDRVICTPGGSKATIVALDKKTGKNVWTRHIPDGRSPGAGYSSPIAIDFDGRRQYVQFTADAVVGVAAEDGKLLWSYENPSNKHGINCSTPLFHDGWVFAASAYGNGGGAVTLSSGAEGAITAEEVYFTNRMRNHHGGMIILDGALYGANGGNSGGFLACIDFRTGEQHWRDRNAPKGSITYADGRIYLRGEDGTLILVEPNSERFIERGRFSQPDRSDSPAWAYPVIANGKLYIRDHDLLLCYDVTAKE